jgi:hypothetical protein
LAAGRVASVPDFLPAWFEQLSAPEETRAMLEPTLADERLLLLVDGLFLPLEYSVFLRDVHFQRMLVYGNIN